MRGARRALDLAIVKRRSKNANGRANRVVRDSRARLLAGPEEGVRQVG